MTTTAIQTDLYLCPELAGTLMTPEEFDAVEDYDEEYRYELIHGVLAVTPYPAPTVAGPNESLGTLLRNYQEFDPLGKSSDETLPNQYVRTRTSRRIADRLVWTGLGRMPRLKEDVPSIAVEIVSRSRRDQKRDYVDKTKDYGKVGIAESWILHRFQRTLTVVVYGPDGPTERIVREGEMYASPLLPGFEFYLIHWLDAADRYARMAE